MTHFENKFKQEEFTPKKNKQDLLMCEDFQTFASSIAASGNHDYSGRCSYSSIDRTVSHCLVQVIFRAFTNHTHIRKLVFTGKLWSFDRIDIS